MFGAKNGEIKRLKQIADTLFKQGLGYAVERMDLKSHLTFHKRIQKEKFSRPMTSLPVRLRKVAEELGCTFIKLAQMLSLRHDLLPSEYCQEFSKLQDSVPPVPFSIAKRVIEIELGGPLKEFFKEFSKIPVASASVGQVHKAKLHSGEIVAVKVQRYGIKDKFEADIALLYRLAKLLPRYFPETKDFDFKRMVDEFAIYTEKELDYMIEARNIEIFSNAFKDDPTVVVPRVFWKFTAPKVLTMAYIEGVKISEAKDFQKLHSTMKHTMDNLLHCMMKQIFDYKIFHADPHPGNILLVGYNKIALLDFGIVGRLLPEIVDEMETVLIGLVQQDLDMVVNAYTKLGMVDPATFNAKEFKEDLMERFAEYYGAQLNQINFATFFTKTFDLVRKYKISLPLNFTLLAKSLMTLQGFCAEYAPGMNLADYVEPKVQEMMKERTQPKYIFSSLKKMGAEMKDFVRAFPADFASLVRTLKNGAKIDINVNNKELNAFSLELDRSSNRLTFGLILAALIIAASIIMHAGLRPLVYGIPLLAYVCFFFIILISISLIVSIFKEGKGGEM